MQKVVAIAVAAVVCYQPFPVFAQMSAVQQEAERELTEIDCEILTMSSDAERIGNEVRSINSRLSSGITATTKATDDAVEEAQDLLQEVAEDIRDQIEGEDSELPVPKKGATIKKIVKAVAPAYRLTTRYGLWIKNVQLAYGIISLQKEKLTMTGERDKMIATARELDQVLPQLEAARTAVARLSNLRKTKEDAYAAKGATVEGRYFGEACTSSKMDGIWRTQFSPGFAEEADVVEIRGGSIKFTSGLSGVTDECGTFTSTLSFANDGSAEAIFTANCKGSHTFMYTKAQFKVFGTALHRNMCQSFSYRQTTCDLNDTDGILEAGGDPLTKVAE